MHCQRCGGVTSLKAVDGRDRPVCDACGSVTYLDPKVAVAIVVAREGRLLLGRRAAWTKSPGTWSFPAGFVERGERVEDAAIREVREETGLDVTLGSFLGVYSHTGNPVVLLAWAAESTSGDAVPGDDLTELAWVSPSCLPPLAFDHDPEIVARWLETQPDGVVRPAEP